MGNIQCTSDKTYNPNVQKCLGQCINYTQEMNSDPYSCVSVISCPGGTTQDPVFENICNKIATPPTNGTCPSGYSLWTPNNCYIDCTSLYQETGLTCLKKTVQKTISLPTCSNFFTIFNDGKCITNYSYFITAGIFLFILFVLILMVNSFQMNISSSR